MKLQAHRKIIVQAVLIGIVISVHDVLLHALFGLAHMTFEWIELGLEVLVEHIFHTTRQQSQIIVFYLLWAFILFGLYRLWRLLPRFRNYLRATWARYRTHMGCYWRECSSLRKVKLITAYAVGATGLFFWAFI